MQPPVLSPLSLDALLRAARLVSHSDVRADLRSLLLREYPADGALLTSSGTHALQLALFAALQNAAAIGSDGPVLALPAFSCYDVATAAVAVGARVTLYDLDPATLAPDLDSLEAAFRRGARVAVAAPLYGLPVPWDAIEAVAARHDALVIEDAAQGHAACWQGRAVGSLGRLTVLSFGRGKGWTGGGGGALLWRGGSAPQFGEGHDPAEAAGSSAARVFGTGLAQWALARPSLYAIPAGMPWLGLGETHYRAPGRARLMSPHVSALVLATHEAAAAEGRARRSRGAGLRSAVVGIIDPIDVMDGAQPGYLRLPVRLRGVTSTHRAVNSLRHLGAAPSYPTTLADVPALQPLLVPGATRWPGASTLVRELFTLPTHRHITPADHARIVTELERIARTER